MEYTRLGRSEIIVSRLALGCWQASPDWQSFDAQRFTQTVYAALSNGITLFDTAPVYGAGSSEELLSKALDSERTRVVIATKFTHRDSAPHKLRLAVEESLRRLRTDYIDLYQQHWPSPNIPFAETQEELLRLQHEGKIRAIGVSNWMEPEFAAHSDLSHIQTLQPSYSLLWRSIEKNVLPLCNEHGIGVLPYSPLCQGILARDFEPGELSDVRLKNTYLNPESLHAHDSSALQSFLNRMDQLAALYDKTRSQLALNWLLAQPGVSTPIVGVSSVQQVNGNCGALGWELDRVHFDELCELSAQFSAALESHDTLWNWHSIGGKRDAGSA